VFEEQLQVIAEQLADALERSVIIEDAALRPVAVSAQTGLVDATRIEAVLQRRTTARHRQSRCRSRPRNPAACPGCACR
jgi:hypothetical protein